jgi:hypothetical protein
MLVVLLLLRNSDSHSVSKLLNFLQSYIVELLKDRVFISYLILCQFAVRTEEKLVEIFQAVLKVLCQRVIHLRVGTIRWESLLKILIIANAWQGSELLSLQRIQQVSIDSWHIN